MTVTLPRFVNLGAIASALAYTTLTFGAALIPAPAEAKSNEVVYRASLAQPVAAKTTTVAGGIAWICRDTTCVAAKSNSRPLRVCRELQREHGQIESFTVRDEALASEDLARCNG